MIILINVFSLLSSGLALSCSNELKQGPYKLTVPPQVLPNITQLTVRIYKYNLTKDSAEMVIGYRGRWSAYCYNGGALDPNTGCFTKFQELPPSRDELSKWSRLEQCETCRDVQDAWGSDSQVCLGPLNRCNIWYTRKELEKRVTNNHFAYHTCEISWRCGVSKSEIPVTMELRTEPTLYVAMPNGTLRLFEEFFHMDGQTSVLIAKPPKIQTSLIGAKCILDGTKYWCIDPDTFNSFTFDMNGKSEFCLYSTCYRFNGELRSKKRGEDYNLKHASLEDLKNIFTKEMLEIEDLKYTVLQSIHRTLIMETMLLRTINSLAKIDDRLLESILGVFRRILH